jgi:carbon-monoxide dehydrogenase medium subunit
MQQWLDEQNSRSGKAYLASNAPWSMANRDLTMGSKNIGAPIQCFAPPLVWWQKFSMLMQLLHRCLRKWVSTSQNERTPVSRAGQSASQPIAAKDFFVDIFTTTLEPSEVLAAIHIRRPAPTARFTYRKIRHPASGYAVVGVAAGLRVEAGLVAQTSIGITGAASHAFSADPATQFLMAKPLSSEAIEEAARLLGEATECLSDRYAPAEYRASLVRTETRRALLALAA